MKKTITCALFLAALCTARSYAQTWIASGSDLVTDPPTNNVGINDNAPAEKLTINGNMAFTADPSPRAIRGLSDMYLEVYGKKDFSNGAGLVLGADGAPGYDGIIKMVSGGNTSGALAFELLQFNGGAYTPLMQVIKNGDAILNGSLSWQPSSTNRRIMGNTSLYTEMYGNTGFADGAGLVLGADGAPGYDGIIKMISGGNTSGALAFELLQFNGGAYTPLMQVIKNGDMMLNGSLSWQPSSTNRRIMGNTSLYTEMYGNTGFADGAGMVLGADGASGYDGLVRFVSGGNSSSDRAFDILQYNGGAYNPLMYLRKDGRMVIGNVNPNTGYDYKLYVQNGILTEKLKVANSSDPLNWSDFVFDEGYELQPLHEVEQFIKENKHLPAIPTAAEVAKDGIDVAEIDAKLLQKIEELTLYVIEQNKRIQTQQGEIDQLKASLRK